MACKVTTHRKFKLSLGVFQKYLYEGIWRQTNPDILTGQDVPHFTGENGNFSNKIFKKSFSVYTFFDEN